MPELIGDLIHQQAEKTPAAPALFFKDQTFTYHELASAVDQFAQQFLACELSHDERVGIYLPKVPDCVHALFATARAGGVFVPVNPLLKPVQVSYILNNCNIRILVTSSDRFKLLAETLHQCHDLRTVILVDDGEIPDEPHPFSVQRKSEQPCTGLPSNHMRRIGADMAAILYTSGSTGNPKGVVLSHNNMLSGAKSVASYLMNTSEDRLLAVLPFSFDYGLSQMTTAFLKGASVVLMDYLFPRDVIKAVAHYQITGLAAVPPLWNQLAELPWPEEAQQSLRYLTNSGGAMPVATTRKLQSALPNTAIYLMYGLTEAFRSTFLPPDQVNIRPESMGKAIPGAEVLVLREDGSECAPGEPGELVHRGALVSLGYWNDTTKTAERFKPIPSRHPELPFQEIAVWSGDQVKRDEEGFLYFISRKDEMIKTSGYRVSPTEVEEVLYSSGMVKEVAALGVPHPQLGQAIVLAVSVSEDIEAKTLLTYCQRELPSFMQPKQIFFATALPRNQNGKIDRKQLSEAYINTFEETSL